MDKAGKEGRRCGWCGNDPLYVKYHDEEWGVPVADDRTLFEFLTLESAQAGLAWITILRKREGYRMAFLDFDYRRVAAMTEADEERLRGFDGIVRNRLKIHAAIVNARLFADIVAEFGSFRNYLLRFFPSNQISEGKSFDIIGNEGDLAPIIVHDVPDESAIPVTSPVSDAISKDMRRRGFRFFGSVICYSFLQATGFIDDHLNSCPRKFRQNQTL